MIARGLTGEQPGGPHIPVRVERAFRCGTMIPLKTGFVSFHLNLSFPVPCYQCHNLVNSALVMDQRKSQALSFQTLDISVTNEGDAIGANAISGC